MVLRGHLNVYSEIPLNGAILALFIEVIRGSRGRAPRPAGSGFVDAVDVVATHDMALAVAEVDGGAIVQLGHAAEELIVLDQHVAAAQPNSRVTAVMQQIVADDIVTAATTDADPAREDAADVMD